MFTASFCCQIKTRLELWRLSSTHAFCLLMQLLFCDYQNPRWNPSQPSSAYLMHGFIWSLYHFKKHWQTVEKECQSSCEIVRDWRSVCICCKQPNCHQVWTQKEIPTRVTSLSPLLLWKQTCHYPPLLVFKAKQCESEECNNAQSYHFHVLLLASLNINIRVR